MSANLTLVLLVLFFLGAAAIAIYLVVFRKNFATDPEGQFFESPQGPIFYRISGKKGPWITLIHGLGASSYCWRHIVPELSEKHRVLTIDLWGFGNSSKNLNHPMNLDNQVSILQDLLDHLKISKTHLVGHSMGGQIAIWLAMQDNRIDHCIAITPATHPSLVTSLLTKFSWVANWTPLVINKLSIRKILLRVISDPAFITEEMLTNYYQPYRNPKAHICFAAALEVIKDNRVYENLPSFKGDLTFLWGAKDHIITPLIQSDVQHRIPIANHFTHPTSRHLPMEEDHQWVAKQILWNIYKK